MGVFRDIILPWKGTDYTIPSKKVMGAIAAIEDVLTIKELYDASSGGNIKFTRIAGAFGAALRYAGAEVEDDEVYAAMFAGEESQAVVVTAITGLLTMMIPPGAVQESATAEPGNAPAKKAAARSSRKPSS